MPIDADDCPRCYGTGRNGCPGHCASGVQRLYDEREPGGEFIGTRACPDCGGQGYVPCSGCGGTGKAQGT